jgi:hypothetical protein
LKNPFKNKEDRAGLYITIIFHLVVIIVLLAYQIDNALRREESFVLDFTKQEEIEKQKKEQIFKEDISKRIEEMLAAARNSGEPVRNRQRQNSADSGAGGRPLCRFSENWCR